jgi:hypothetical protein
MQGAAARLGIAALGFAILPVALALYMAAGGVVDDFIDIQRHYTAHYNTYRELSGLSQLRFMLDETWSFITRASFLVVPAVGALFLGFFRSREARGVVLVSILTLLGVAAIWWQGKMFSYHWVVLLPLLALLAGYALDEAVAQFGRLRLSRALAAYALLSITLIVLAYPALRDTYDDYRVLVRYADGSMSRRDVEAHYHFLYPQNHQVVDYVKAHGGPDDRVFVWGLWPQVYFWLDRPLVDRFLVNSGLRATWAPQSWRREVMRDLAASPPRFFAIGRGDTQPWLVGTSQTSEEHLRDSFPELRLFLEENYLPVLDLDLFLLYELRPAAVRAGL